MENLLFPMQTLRVTQGEDTGSHLGSWAMDFGGRDGGRDPVFAPCTGEIVRLRGGANGELYLWSDGCVCCPGGYVGPVTVTLLHADRFIVRQGQRVRQGEHIYDEGGLGRGRHGAFGNHLHLEVCRGHVPPRQAQNRFGSWYTVGSMLHLPQALFLPADTVVADAGGCHWVRLAADKTPPGAPARRYTVRPGDSWWRIAAEQLGSGPRCAALAKANGKSIAAVLHPGDVLTLEG